MAIMHSKMTLTFPHTRPVLFFIFAACSVMAVSSQHSSIKTRYKTTRGTYKFPPRVDDRVLANEETELWAEVTRPNLLRDGPYPLVIFIHGNHGTCGRTESDGIRSDFGTDYTFSGECTGENPIVVPNHKGYRYASQPLSMGGAIVVSINANRGITGNSGGEEDSGLNLARGRLILSHLELLAKWHSGKEETPVSLGASLAGQIDFSNVGLMGHSRGGEGARAALQLYRDRNSTWPVSIGEKVDIKALFEIAPVDGQTSRELNVRGVASAIILPSCDGDVSKLSGMKVFDRAFDPTMSGRLERIKATFLVVGANHNGFNTEWQESEIFECNGARPIFRIRGKSKRQQRVIQKTLIPFFRAALFGEERKNRIFDPGFSLPAGLQKITFFERGHLRAPPSSNTGVKVIQTFSEKGMVSDAGFENEVVGLTVAHRPDFLFEHEEGLRTARLDWSTRGNHSYTVNLSGTQSGLNLSDVNSISFRVALGCRGELCNSLIDDDKDVDIRVTFENKESSTSRQVPLSDYTIIRRPTSASFEAPHDVLQTVDIPVNAFIGKSGFKMSSVGKIRFDIVDLPGASSGRVYLGQITTDTASYRQSTFETISHSAMSPTTRRAVVGVQHLSTSTMRSAVAQEANQVTRRLSSMRASLEANGEVKVVLSSMIRFPITDSMPVLKVGPFEKGNGMVLRTGEIQFMLSRTEFLGLSVGERVLVLVGASTWRMDTMATHAILLH